MPGHADRTQANRADADKAQANDAARAGHHDGAQTDTTPALADHRPAAIAQRKLQQALDDSPRVAQLRDVKQLIGAAPAVRQLAALQATQADAPDIPTDQPVQRVVRWNSINYTADTAAKELSFRRALARAGAANIDEIVAHAQEVGTYVYTGLKPVLKSRPAAPAPLPVQLPPAQLPLAQNNAPAPDVLHDQPAIVADPGAQHDAPALLPPALLPPVLLPPAQDDAPPPVPVQNDAPAPGPGAQNAAPLPLPVPLAQHPAPLVVAARGRHQSAVALPRAVYDHDRAGLVANLGAKSIADYQAQYDTRTGVVNALDDPGFGTGQRVYHATPIETARLIKATGLQPKKSAWGGASASKDNYLSFATNPNDANALGGVAIVLRVALRANEVGDGKWRRASDTEVITTQTFLPGRLKWSRKIGPLVWQPMADLPDA